MFTLPKSRAGSPNAATRSTGSRCTRTASWKPTTRWSPRSSAALTASRQRVAYQAQSGSTPRRDESLSGRTASTCSDAPVARRSPRSAPETKGMSQATMRMSVRVSSNAVSIPASAPAPGRRSATVRTPGSHVAASGAFATRSRSSVTRRSARATRSMIRRPSTDSSPLGRPPKRRAAPPARITPVQREPGSLTASRPAAAPRRRARSAPSPPRARSPPRWCSAPRGSRRPRCGPAPP